MGRPVFVELSPDCATHQESWTLLRIDWDAEQEMFVDTVDEIDGESVDKEGAKNIVASIAGVSPDDVRLVEHWFEWGTKP